MRKTSTESGDEFGAGCEMERGGDAQSLGE